MSNCIWVQMSTFSDRLKDERVRLGFNQTDFAEIAGVQRRAQVNYESGERAPDAKYLEKITAVGVDIQYVVTGKKASTGGIDEMLLEKSVEQAERLMEAAGKRYTAAQKARIISLVYQVYVEENTLSDESLGRILRLVS